MVHFFDMEQTPEYGGLCYGEGGNYGRVGPTSKVTTPLAYIDNIINDLIQIFMVNKKSCGNLRMCVKYFGPPIQDSTYVDIFLTVYWNHF